MVVHGTDLILGLLRTKPDVIHALTNWDSRSMARFRPSLVSPFYKTQFSDQELFPRRYFIKIEKMAEFVVHITRPDGKITQIGDCDNGRFLKLNPVYDRRTVDEAASLYRHLSHYRRHKNQSIYWDENHLNNRHIVAAINAFFNRTDFAAFLQGDFRETDMVKLMLQGRTVPSYRTAEEECLGAESIQINDNKDFHDLADRILSSKNNCEQKITIPYPSGNLRDELQLYGYPDFGLFIFRSPSVYMTLRCGQVEYNLRNGHAHNDQLSMELLIDDNVIFCDPGTYLYTPQPHQRNRYRSVRAHFCPQIVNVEPSNLDRDLFFLDTRIQSDCLYFGKSGFIGRYHGYQRPVYRIVEILDDKIKVVDIASGNQRLKNIYNSVFDHPAPLPVSPGYGLRYA